MRAVHGRVLVIDDDPVMLKVLCDLLEKAGYRVVVRDSPVGATQVILRERIDAAVIDLNLPAVQGDDVVRLLRTWEEVKDLPVLLITGAAPETLTHLRDALPGVRVLSKENLNNELVFTLGSVLGTGNTVRGLMPVQPGKSEATTAPQPRNKDVDLVPQLLAELAGAVPSPSTLWSEVARGEQRTLGTVVERLERLSGQANLLALSEAAELMHELCSTLRALPLQRKVPREVKRAVEGGIAALSSLPQSSDGAFTMPPEPLIAALQRARADLSDAPRN
jgi:CheY-like chemotaxis protein